MNIFQIYFLVFFIDLSFVSVNSEEGFFSLWNTFWQRSCDISPTMTSRSKRSLDTYMALDTNDPEKMFQYLYPLATRNTSQESGRSASNLMSVFDLVEDLLELWVSECHLYKSRKSRTTREVSNIDGSEESSTEMRYDHDTDGDLVNTTSTKTEDKPSEAPKDSSDEFFAQYGGDIEYFFPLISFGIPFDGEITFLGFHGFKGIFPYK